MEPITSKPFIQNFSSSRHSKVKALKLNNSTWTPKQMALAAGGIISTVGLTALAYKELTSPVIYSSKGSWVLKGIIGATTLAIFLKNLKNKSDGYKEASSNIRTLPSNSGKCLQEKEKSLREIEYEKINQWIDTAKNFDKNNDEYKNIKHFFEGEWHNNKSFGELLSKFHSLTLDIDPEYAENLAATCKESLKSHSGLLTPFLHDVVKATLKNVNHDTQQKIKLSPSLLSNSPDSTSTSSSLLSTTTTTTTTTTTITNKSKRSLKARVNDTIFQLPITRENELINTLEFIKELQKSTPQTADYIKIDQFLEKLIAFHNNDFELNTFEIGYYENIYNKLSCFFTLTGNNIDFFGESLKKFHSVTLMIDYEKAINIAAYCVNHLKYNSKENSISHEIIKATIQDPQYKNKAKDYPELRRYAEIRLNEEINSFITSMEKLQKNEVEKSDYEKINQWVDYLLKINAYQKEETIKLSDSQSTLHNNLAKSLCKFFESKNCDNEFFKNSFEKFFFLTLEFYPRLALNLVVNPNLKFYFKNFNPEDIKEEFKIPFAIACAEKADDWKILKSFADKIWHSLKGVAFLQGCAKINNVFCQNKVRGATILFRETTFDQETLDLFDACIENLFDENSNLLLEGNKVVVNVAYENFSNKDNKTKLKLSNSFEKVQSAYSKAGFILPLDIKDEAPNQCAIDLFDPLFHCLVRSHGKTTDSSNRIEKLLNISKKFKELQAFYDQAIQTLRNDKDNDWSLVISKLENDQQEIQKNKQNTLSLTGTS